MLRDTGVRSRTLFAPVSGGNEARAKSAVQGARFALRHDARREGIWRGRAGLGRLDLGRVHVGVGAHCAAAGSMA